MNMKSPITTIEPRRDGCRVVANAQPDEGCQQVPFAVSQKSKSAIRAQYFQLEKL
jgi:hypothetical protein